jgi:anaerobic magnesium-protoporphyrin IX monomethyl ester cyclase
MAELVAGFDKYKIQGLIWRKATKVIVNEPRIKISDLDSLPFSTYEKLANFPHDYHLPQFSAWLRVSMLLL